MLSEAESLGTLPSCRYGLTRKGDVVWASCPTALACGRRGSQRDDGERRERPVGSSNPERQPYAS